MDEEDSAKAPCKAAFRSEKCRSKGKQPDRWRTDAQAEVFPMKRKVGVTAEPVDLYFVFSLFLHCGQNRGAERFSLCEIVTKRANTS